MSCVAAVTQRSVRFVLESVMLRASSTAILGIELVGILLGAPEPISAQSASATQSTFALEATRRYRITHEVALTPTGDPALTKLTVVVPAPVDLQHQKLRAEPTAEVRPLSRKAWALSQPDKYFALVRTAPFGLPVVHVELNRPARQREWKVRLQYEVEVSNLRFNWEEVREVRFSQVTELDPASPYLQPETLVESRHADIQAALKQVFPDGIDPNQPACDVAKAVYLWVLDHSTYQTNARRGRESKLWGALDLLHSGQGECGDYAALLVALCRAAGIPARSVVGFWANRGQANAPHVWAEFFLPGIGWIPVDPSVGDSGWLAQERCFGNLRDLNQRIAVTFACDHHVDDLKVDFLQAYHYWFWYNGPAATLQPSYRFTVESIQP
jgi:transglutaminase-like putative cysteine protease